LSTVALVPLDYVVIDMRARTWCKLPYPDHPKGCPNYNKKEGCPPTSELFTDLVDPPYLLVGVKFDLEGWANKMKEKHPNWSDRQARCCLYWQGKVRKELREICEKMCQRDQVILYAPESNGVHVFKTCKQIGMEIERNPQVFVWKIAIIGKRKNG